MGKSIRPNPYQRDIIVDPMGQWNHPGKNTRIPSSSITMKGVNYPVLGVSNTGQKQMMQPGKEYNFPGADYVDEYPQMAKGGASCPSGQKVYPDFKNFGCLTKSQYDSLKDQKTVYINKRNAASKKILNLKNAGKLNQYAQEVKQFKIDYPNQSYVCPGPNCPDNVLKVPSNIVIQPPKKPIIINPPSNPVIEKPIDPVRPPVELEIKVPNKIDYDFSDLELQGELPETELPQYFPSDYDMKVPTVSIGPGKTKSKKHSGRLMDGKGQRYKHTTYKQGKDLDFGTREATRIIPGIVQKSSGYDPKYMEGYTDDEGNYIPGEIEKAQEEGRRINFRGASSLKDLREQKRYNEEYDKIDDAKKLEDYYNKIYSNRSYKAGGLTKAQTGIATYQDSLDVYNNALQQQAYYDKLKPYYDKTELKKNYYFDLAAAKQAQKETSNYLPPPSWTPQDKANFQKTKNIIKNNKDKNVAYLTDIITGMLDPNAPALRYDGRIKSQGVKIYDPYLAKYTPKEQQIIDKINKIYGDNLGLYNGKQTWLTKKDVLAKGKKLGYTEKEIIGILYKAKKESAGSEKLKGFITQIPYYDPLAVKPGKLLTDDEIKKRVKLYGTTGIPIDRLKKLGLNNSPPSKTNTPTVVKSPCSNPITTVINNVPEKAPFGKKLVGTDEETITVAGKKCEYVKTINPIYEDIKIEPIELQKFPVKIDNGPLPPLQMHDYTLPDPIEAPQYTLDPYTADRLSLDVKLPQNKIAALFDSGVIDSKGHIALGKRNKTRLIPRIVQKATGYDPAYFEGYEDEEGNFVPGELDYGNATGSEMEFRGAASLRDFINQQKYKKEYEEYDEKLDTWLEQYEQSKKKQEQGQAFKKGGAKKKYTSDIINSTNYLFAEHPLFKKKKQSKKRIYSPKASYYQDGGQTDYNIGDEVDEATMQYLKKLGFTFEKI